jgi:hypothetical protein
MLMIRDEMWGALADSTHAQFVSRVATHLRRFFPMETAAFSDVRLGQLIEAGVTRARFWGFVSEADICQYAGLMCVFGQGFDADAALPWARNILASHAPPDPSSRMRRLQKAAQDVLRRNGGSVA